MAPFPFPSPSPRCRRSPGLLAVALGILGAGLLHGSTMPVAAADQLARVLRSPHEREGHLDALADDWIELLGQESAGPATELALHRLQRVALDLPDPDRLRSPLELLLGDEARSARARQLIRSLLATLHTRAGRETELRALDPARGFLVHWAVIGPLGTGARSQLRRSFAPEEEIDLERPLAGRRRELRWRPVALAEGDRQVNTRVYLRRGSGVFYHLAQVHSGEPRQVIFEVHSESALVVLLNGVPRVLETHDTYHSSPRRYNVRLERGWNRVLVKTTGSPFALGVTDAAGERLPAAALRQEDSFRLHPLPAKVGGGEEGVATALVADWEVELAPAPGDGEGPGEGGGEAESGDRGAAEPPDRHLALALLHHAHGRSDLAVHHAATALDRSPEDPFCLYHAGRIYRGARHLPADLARRRARSALEKAAAGGEFLPAKLEVARLLFEEEQSRQAAMALQSILEHNPRYLPAARLLLEVYEEAEWEAEALELAGRIEVVAPLSSAPAVFRAELAERRDNVADALEHYRVALGRDRGRSDLLERIADLEQRRGSLDAAREALREWRRREPASREPVLALAQLEIDASRLDEAAALLRERIEAFPEDTLTLREFAATLDRAGRREEATTAWQSLRVLEPGDLATIAYLAQRAGKPPERFWQPFDEKLEDWIARIPESSAFPRAASLAVLDIGVIRVFPDGSTSEYTHQAQKILSDAGKEELARVQTPGEILLLRTRTPDGAIHEPVAATGRESFVMPALEPGAIIEFAYRRDTPNFAGWIFEKGRFYFQDYSYRQPMLLSRYAILMPPEESLSPGFSVEILERAFRDRPRHPFVEVRRDERTLPGGGRVVLFEARDVPRLQPEAFMPPREEYIASASLLEKRTWLEVADILGDRYLARTRLTPELREFAREATAGIPDPLERARSLFSRVNDLIRKERGPDEALGVLLERAGSRNVLYRALLDAAGVPAHWAFARARRGVAPAANLSHPSLDVFTYPLILVEPQGSPPVWVDLGARHAPFGKLPFEYHGGTALVIEPAGPRVLPIPAPPPEESSESLEVNLKLGEGDGAPLDARVTLDWTIRSYRYLARKPALENLDQHRRRLALATAANSLFPQARVHEASMPGIDAPGEPFRIRLELTAPRHLQVANDTFLLRSVVAPLNMVRNFVRTPTREHPYHFREQVVKRDRLRVDPGEAYRFGRLPAGAVLLSPLGSYSLRFSREGPILDVERHLTLEPGALSPGEFLHFLEFAKSIDEAEAKRIILTRAGGARD